MFELFTKAIIYGLPIITQTYTPQTFKNNKKAWKLFCREIKKHYSKYIIYIDDDGLIIEKFSRWHCVARLEREVKQLYNL